MNRITLPSAYYNALRAAKADDDDVRFYLCGICLDSPNKRALATDGWCLLITPIETTDCLDDAPPVIVPCNTKKAPRDGEVIIEWNDDKVVKIDAYTKTEKHAWTSDEKTIDGRFPDVDKIVADALEHVDWTQPPVFNPSLIAMVTQELAANGTSARFVRIHQTDPECQKAFHVEISSEPSVQFFVMPARW